MAKNPSADGPVPLIYRNVARTLSTISVKTIVLVSLRGFLKSLIHDHTVETLPERRIRHGTASGIGLRTTDDLLRDD
ncbi:MAG: hypothetical protein KGS72_24290, partial [Cyanobacteria bacterium REEB67]|nr:hypothetical protein [Cyanobacteria bacterium REEB67]